MSNIYVGMDVHQTSITLAVLPEGDPTPSPVDRLPNDPKVLQRYLGRLASQGLLQVCSEASGAGFVLHRALTAWGHACTVIATRVPGPRSVPAHPRRAAPADEPADRRISAG